MLKYIRAALRSSVVAVSGLISAPLIAAPIVGNYTQTSGITTADAIFLGVPPAGSQSATISGASTVLILNGTTNRIGVGEQTIGTMTVSGGAYVNAALIPAACLPNACNQFIGNGAGSTGTLTITGPNSQVDTLNGFVVGNTSVFSTAVNGFDFGVPGGTTTASVSVTNGGALNSNRGTIAAGPSPNAGNAQTGNERSNASVLIDGAGSVWNLITNTVTSVVARLTVAAGPNTTGTLDLKNGGKIVIDGTPDTTAAGLSPGLNIARETGSNGTVRIDGTNGGASITIKGNTGFLNVAGSSASNNGTASLQVTNGGVIQGGGGANDFNFLGVGGGSATAGNGTVLISGTGSRISLGSVEGVGSTTPGAGGGVTIGRGTGTGAMTVSSGGALIVDTTGLSAIAGPFINVGRDATSTGTLNISGVGSKVTITSDTVSPFMAVGRGGIGSLNITGGGQLQLNGNGQSTVATPNSNQLFIGGGGSVVGGTGTAIVSGLGSAIELNGTADRFVQVGFGAGSNGSLTVQNGGSVSALAVLVGNSTGTGNLIVNNGILSFTGTGQGGISAGIGGGLAIGRGTGSIGSATLTNGAIVNVNSGGVGGGVSVGGSQTAAGGVGSLTMSGGSVINMGGSSIGGGLAVGNNNAVGTMTVNGPGTIVNASGYADGGRVIIAANSTATGTLTVANNALVNAGALLGVGHNGTASTGGAGTLILNSGGKAQATSIFVGTGGMIAGNGGILSGNVVSNGGFISPGLSPGQLTIEGGYTTQSSGRFLLEIQSNGLGGFTTDSVLFKGITAGDLSFAGTEFDISFLGDTDPLAFMNSAFDTLDSFFLFDNGGGAQGISHLASLGSIFNGVAFAVRSDSYVINSFTFTADNGFTSLDVSRIPEPGSLALVALGMLGLAEVRRRTARRASSPHAAPA